MITLSLKRFSPGNSLYVYTNEVENIQELLIKYTTGAEANITMLKEPEGITSVKTMNKCMNPYSFGKLDAIRAFRTSEHWRGRSILVSDIDVIFTPKPLKYSNDAKSEALNYYHEHGHKDDEFKKAMEIITNDELRFKPKQDGNLRISSGFMYITAEFCDYILEHERELCRRMKINKEEIFRLANHFGDELIFTVLYSSYNSNIVRHTRKNNKSIIYWTCFIKGREWLLLPAINKANQIHLPALKWQHKPRKILIFLLKCKLLSDDLCWTLIYIHLNILTAYQQMVSSLRAKTGQIIRKMYTSR
jgi:hypothetical protein